MKTYLDCLPCMVNQALRAGKQATDKEDELRQIIVNVGENLKELPLNHFPPQNSEFIYREITRITGVEDPYAKVKHENIQEALALVPQLNEIVSNSDDSLLTAIRIAIAGNVIDLGVDKEFNIVEDVKKILKQDFAVFDYQKFKAEYQKASHILYLGDNCGESVFDRILIEQLDKKVTYAVREVPIINDVTYKDAVESGIHEVAEIISSGSTAPATVLSMCSEEFLKLYHSADMIISKGQGNYESLSDENRRIFFLLKAKCPVISNHLGTEEGGIILKASH